MNWFEKLLLITAVLCMTAVILRQAWLHGNRTGWRECDAHYQRLLADEVEFRIKDFRRVQGLREQSEYERGRRSCEK